MNRWWDWRPWRRHTDRSAEACALLREVEQRDPQVKDLQRQLREAQRRNHFSEMVYVAIAHHRAG